MIPARYASTRFPYKLVQPLGNKTVIRHTYDNVVATRLFSAVYVVTDDAIIFKEITKHGGNAIMSKQPHESGSDRIAEAVADMEADIILNVQGDEPFVQKKPLQQLLQAFDDSNVQVASLMKKFIKRSLVSDPNYVKVITDKHNDAMYFSRSIIPHQRDDNYLPEYFEHIGVYAFRKAALLQFTKWPAAKAERAEKLEQLRYLENGVKIRMVETAHTSVKIDVPSDLQLAERYLASLAKKE